MTLNNHRIFNRYEKFLKTIKVPLMITLNKNPLMVDIAEKVLYGIEKDKLVLEHLKILKEYDEYTHHHSLNVAMLSFFLGFHKCYSVEELLILTKGALLHDIGKTKIPLNILNKPGRLTSDEFSVIQTHSVAGYNILENLDLEENAKQIVLYHHTRLDDSGYPILRENHILNENVQIVSLCDVFDALTGDRVYKPGMSKVSAYRIIHSEMSGKLNTDLLDCLIDNISIFDVGEITYLNTQEKCKIIALNTNQINRPIVQILGGKNDGKTIDLTVDRSVDLIYT